MLPIPYGLRYTATLQGRVPKLVCCEKCGYEYVYLLSRKSRGEGTSLLFVDNQGAQARAQSEATDRLTRKLEAACDPVPCPACGWLQRTMVARARKLRYGWMGTLMVFLCPVAAIMFCVALCATLFMAFVARPEGRRHLDADQFLISVWIAAALTCLPAIALGVLHYQLRKRFDPNSEDAEIRKQRGKTLAVSKEELLK